MEINFIDPYLYARQFAKDNGITQEEAKIILKAKYSKPQKI